MSDQTVARVDRHVNKAGQRPCSLPLGFNYLEDLSAEQRAAVVDPSPKSLVMAGAGSGKTRVLVARIAHLLSAEGLSPDQLLAFSFTRKACEEISHRVRRQFGSSGSGVNPPQMAFTFNGFAFRLIRRYHRELGFRKLPTILAGEEEANPADAFSQFICQTGLPIPSGSPADFLARMRPGPGAVADPRAEFLESAFTEWKIQQGQIELRDQVPLALRLLKGHVGETLRNHLRAVLIDEFQDIDDLQHQLFERLLGPSTCFTLYGDDDQAIYRWRGSRPELIRAYFRRDDVSRHLLTTNYRCRASILTVASDVVSGDRDRIAKPARAHRKGGARPRCIVGSDQAILVARTLQRLHCHGRTLESMVVLVRDHFDGRLVARAVKKMGLAVSDGSDSPGIRLMTLHGSKGLEFPVVLMPFLDRSRFPNTRLLAREEAELRRQYQDAVHSRRLLKHIGARLCGLKGTGDSEVSNEVIPPGGWPLWIEWVKGRFRGKEWVRSRVEELERARGYHEERALWAPVLKPVCAQLPGEHRERLAEERRLCYVAMTRAQDELYLFCNRRSRCSQFLRGIRRGAIEWADGNELL